MIPDGVRINFQTLCRAFEDNNACLMECKRKSDGKVVSIICAVDSDSGEYLMIPFAEMIDVSEESPFDQYYPPDPKCDTGFFEGDIYEEANEHRN